MIFVDTSFWVALRLRRDSRHDDAVALLDEHGGTSLVTSNQVRGETWTFLRARGGHRDGVAFLDMVERTPRLQVAFVDESLERGAVDWLRQHDERPYSFVDATSFALMAFIGIREALAFDGDFAAAGFVELRPE
jgi:predicted nucleic acid-binding protein